jgi:hypothetical protein
MTPPIGFRTHKTADSESSAREIRASAAITEPPTVPTTPSRAADYAYRIVAVTAGLILLATVM